MRKSTQQPSNVEESSENEDFEDQDESKGQRRLSNRAKGDKKAKKGQKKVLTSSESEPEGDENVDETNSENTTAKKKRLSARNGQKSQNGKKSASSDEGSPIIQPPKSAARSSRARRIK